MTVKLINGQRETATLNYEIPTVWKTRQRTTPQTANGTGTGHQA